MSQDIPTGFGPCQMPMRHAGFGTTSTPVDFDNPIDMNGSFLMDHRAYNESFTSETDESMSPRSHSSSMFDFHDLIHTSPDMDYYDSIFFDNGPISMQNPMPQMATGLSSVPDVDYPDEYFQPSPSQHDLPSRGTSFLNSRPPTRNSLSFISTSSHSGQNVRHSVDETIDDSVTSSPTSSSSQCEGRDHPFYRRTMEADGLYHCPMEADGTCDFPPKALKCEYHKHIDSHLKPFRCRKPGCANQAFSSVACRLRHEREMHKMHNAEEFLCRYDGPCERKQPGNGFARSFNRGDHEKRVHQIFQENTRSKGRPKGVPSEPSATQSAARRNSAQRKLSHHRDGNCASDESSASTIGAIGATSPKRRLQKHAAQVNAPLAVTSMDTSMVLASGTNFGSPLNTTVSMMQNQAQIIPGFPGTKRTRFSKNTVKPNARGASQTPKRRSEREQYWFERARKIRTLALNLPDVPDDSSGDILHSINEEAYELLLFQQDPRHMDDHELRPSPIYNSW